MQKDETKISIRRWSIQRALWTTGIFGVSLVTILSFQNCTQPVPVEGESELQSQASKLDFAYDAFVDQISYMSCSGINPGSYDSGAYYTFRAGAYRSGGLKLRDAFRDGLSKKPVDVQVDLVTNSPANTNTILQLAVRDVNNFQSIRAMSGGAAGEDYMNMLEPLGTSDMSYLLLTQDPAARMKYVRNGTVYGSRMEASLYFTHSFEATNSIRNYTTNNSYLALTYSHAPAEGGSNSETFARSPADVYTDQKIDANRVAYGRGYQFRFTAPVVYPTFSQQPVMSEVREVNLENSTDRTGMGSWACPNSLQFRIVRAADLSKAGANCVMKPDPAVMSSELSLIRNTLRSEDWYVDLDNRCIIPKKSGTDCYGSAKEIKYNMGEACNPADPNAACVSFASICYRTN